MLIEPFSMSLIHRGTLDNLVLPSLGFIVLAVMVKLGDRSPILPFDGSVLLTLGQCGGEEVQPGLPSYLILGQ